MVSKLCAGLVVVLVMAACADGGFTSGMFGPGGDSWESRFADLPAPDGDAQVAVMVWDQERAMATADVEPDDVEGFAEATISGPMAATIPQVLDPQTWMLEGFREGNGYGRSDVAWAVEVSAPPTAAATLGGDFDLAELEAVNGPADNGTIDSDDPMAVSPQDRVPGRPLGRQPRYDLEGDRLQVTRWMNDPTDGPRAIEDARIADLARTLDDVDAYAAYAVLGDEGIGGYLVVDEPLPDDVAGTSALPLPYVGVAIAFPEPDDDGIRASMIFLHRDADVAEVNAEAVVDVLAGGEVLRSRERWSEVVTDVEVVHDDRVVRADVRLVAPRPPNTLIGLMHSQALIPSAD